MIFDRRQMRLLELPPNAGSCLATACAARLHWNAGATNHGVQLIARHEFSQSAPQRQNYAARSVVCMHTTAAQLNHSLTQAAQAGQVKLGVTVGAASALGLCWRQHTISTNDFATGLIANQQVFTVIVKQVDVVAGNSDGQRSTHFYRKNLIP